MPVASKEKKDRKNDAGINKQQTTAGKKTESNASKEEKVVEVKAAVQEKFEEIRTPATAKESSEKAEKYAEGRYIYIGNLKEGT